MHHSYLLLAHLVWCGIWFVKYFIIICISNKKICFLLLQKFAQGHAQTVLKYIFKYK